MNFNFSGKIIRIHPRWCSKTCNQRYVFFFPVNSLGVTHTFEFEKVVFCSAKWGKKQPILGLLNELTHSSLMAVFFVNEKQETVFLDNHPIYPKSPKKETIPEKKKPYL